MDKRKAVLRALLFLAILEVVLIFGLLLITDAPQWLYVLAIVNGWAALVLGFFNFKSNYYDGSNNRGQTEVDPN